MSAVEYSPRPARISPLIKCARWGLLITGIMYGAYHHRRFSNIENARREKEERERPEREARLAEERKRARAAEDLMLQELMTPKTKK